jgi:hypothetical protein
MTDTTVDRPTLPEIDLSNHPVVSGIEESGELTRGADAFLENGFLVIRNAFESEYIEKLFDAYVSKYEAYFIDKPYADALKVGDKRTMISVALEGVFNSGEYYANPKLTPLLKYLLGPNVIMNSLGSVVSLPGALDQRIHRDAPNIYVTPTNRGPDYSWIKFAPPYAITLGIPLVPITELNGSTRFWPGTHLRRIKPEEVDFESGIDYVADAGTCVLFDYRILHSGLANNSDQIRPMMYNVYSRPWYRDTVNYKKQDSLIIPDEEYRRIPEIYRQLFSWTRRGQAQNPVTDEGSSRNALCYCGSGFRFKYCHGKLT